MPQSVDMTVKSSSTPPTRQNPGAACEECRRRKVRCDRQQPSCGLCLASGVQCQVTTPRPPRGPKRGYLKALQARIATLEGTLLQQQQHRHQQQHQEQHQHQPQTQPQPQQNGNEATIKFSPETSSIEGLTFNDQQSLPWDFPMTADENTSLHDLCPGTAASNGSVVSSLDGSTVGASTSPIQCFDATSEGVFSDSVLNRKMSEMSEAGLDGINISNLMQADLDQLYFDRVQTFAPIIHQRRYFSWARSIAKTEAQTCLRYAMWTLAASVSAHYHNIGDALYRYTRQALESLDSKSMSLALTEMEQVQAWLLLAIHEFMCVDFSRSWVSAGRAFRLIQLNWLQYADAPDMGGLAATDWVDAEQKRRTFWMAYCLDRFVSVRNGSPMTFNEQNTIRLPAPEVDFQNEQPTLMGFLSEAVTATARDGGMVTSKFTECIVVATVIGRALSHRQQSMVDNLYLSETRGFWERHEWISAILAQRMELFALNYPQALQEADPMLLFIGLMWRTAVLYLYQLMKSAVQPAAAEDKRPHIIEYTRQSSIAAKEVVGLTNKLSHLNCLKVHPLTSIPLSLCAEFFATYHELGDNYSKQLQDVSEAMHGLMSFNNLGSGFASYSR
ncbi:fungal-specific transcription factor domain-containing protein [Xylariaceae sp. FL0662B]|nr:fungal-specific transcription factor domain-containing protein [Xylariaceae sp. FL0662B]